MPRRGVWLWQVSPGRAGGRLKTGIIVVCPRDSAIGVESKRLPKHFIDNRCLVLVADPLAPFFIQQVVTHDRCNVCRFPVAAGRNR